MFTGTGMVGCGLCGIAWRTLYRKSMYESDRIASKVDTLLLFNSPMKDDVAMGMSALNCKLFQSAVERIVSMTMVIHPNGVSALANPANNVQAVKGVGN